MTIEQLRFVQEVAGKTGGFNHQWWLHAYHEDKPELHTEEDNRWWNGKLKPLLDKLEIDTGLPRADLLNSLVLWTRGDSTSD